jgi:hypothetical protein
VPRLAGVIALFAIACARETRPDVTTGKIVPAQLVTCGVDAPAAATTGSGVDVAADFQVDVRGRVRDVHVQGAKGAYANALRRHLESCKYAPATRDGQPVATRRAVLYGAYR